MPDLRVRALQLLARREHSRAELQRKLATHAESPEELDQVLDTLQAERLLSDHRFAAQRVIMRAQRYGDARLKQELLQRGIKEADIAAAMPEAGDEAERCRSVWSRKFDHLPLTPEERGKQMRFLQYRGFSGDAIRRVLRGVEE